MNKIVEFDDTIIGEPTDVIIYMVENIKEAMLDNVEWGLNCLDEINNFAKELEEKELFNSKQLIQVSENTMSGYDLKVIL